MSLKNVFETNFKVGTSVSAWNVESAGAKAQLAEHYNSITAENEMKPMFVLDEKANTKKPRKYNKQPALCFDTIRKYLEFAKENGIALRGHTLVWHNQTPEWFFKKKYSTSPKAPLADRDTMLARMEGYIKGVLTFVQTEYPDVIYAWDVVNEVIDETEEDNWRKSLWYKTVGEDFVLQAFRIARKYAAPSVSLFYNDYNSFVPEKKKAICDLVLEPLMAEGLVDGMGMQSHLILGDHSLEEYEDALHCYGSKGLQVQVTELDIHCNDAGDEAQQNLAEMYGRLFRILINAKKEGLANVTNVTFWGMKDDESWLTGFRKERSYPLLFGNNYEKKAAYYAVLDAVNPEPVEEEVQEEENSGMSSKMIEALKLVLPLIKDMTGFDMQLSLCDRETAIDTWPAKGFNMPGAIPGLKLEWDNPAQRGMLEVMESGVPGVNFMPKEIFGVPIKGLLTPIFEDGEVVGLVACAYSLEEENKIRESIETLDMNLGQSRESVEEIAKEATNLAEKLNSIQEISEVMRERVNTAAGMVVAIQGNASRSNILALNASIEAARAGEMGKGFAVVADEMGKLAQASGNSAKDISQSLEDIIAAVNKVTEAVNDANDAATNQAAATEEVTATLTDITESVGQIAKKALDE